MKRHARAPLAHPRLLASALVVVGALALSACGSSAGGGLSRPALPSITVSAPSISASVPDRSGDATGITPTLPTSGGPTTSESVAPTEPPADTSTPDATTSSPEATTTITSTATVTRPAASATVSIVASSSSSVEITTETQTQSGANKGVLIGLAAVILLALLIGALIARSRRKGRIRAEAAALTSDTRTTMDSSVAQILAVSDPGSRSLSWPAVDAELVALQRRWEALAAGSGEAESAQAEAVSGHIGELLIAVRAENDALLQGLDWQLLRPRVDQERAAINGLLVELTPAGRH